MRGAVLPAIMIACAAAVGVTIAHAAAALTHFANADDPAAVASGKQIYKLQCSSCHGRSLEGQALWQLDDQYAGRRAPAHDASGHTWRHSDEDLFHMVKYGRFPEAPKDAPSYMPAYSDNLTDKQILDVLAFIKARWPTGLRISQALLNPGLAGMPRDADKYEWTLPPTCTASYQRWKTISR